VRCGSSRWQKCKIGQDGKRDREEENCKTFLIMLTLQLKEGKEKGEV
jgi:hypothetical protein